VVGMAMRHHQQVDRRELVQMDGARRTGNYRALLKRVEEDWIHKADRPGHFYQHRGVTKQRDPHDGSFWLESPQAHSPRKIQ
jgi:hypothetical protein